MKDLPDQDLELWGPARNKALRELKRQVAAWGLTLPDATPLVLQFGLHEFRDVGEIEYRIVNERKSGYCGKFLFVFDGQTCPHHYHDVKHETFFIVKGKVRMKINGRTRIMKQGDRLVMKPGTRHSFAGVGNALLLEVSMPSSVDDNFFDDKRIGHNGII